MTSESKGHFGPVPAVPILLASNSEIYYKAISSKLTVKGNDNYNIKSLTL